MPAFLRVSGKGSTDRFMLPMDRPVLIGRGEGCDLRIDHRSLSRLHCAIEFESGRWHLADCKSTNGTRVAGFRVSETVIQPGEVIQIGDIRIEFNTDSSAPAGRDAEHADLRYPLAGRHFARFELLRRVHVGSSGTVYLARESDRNREVALKILGRDLMVDEATRKRFERGVRAAAPLAHPGIVQLYATGRTEGQTWLSMEWVDGPSVRELLDSEQRLSPAETVRIIRGMASAVESIASQGIVHRNIRPSSILLTANGEPKLTDFVLARSIEETPANLVTQAGEIVGDTEYLAPECFRDSNRVDSRADVYSLGVCLYAMLTGCPPFREPNISRLMHRVLHDPVVPPSQLQPQIPRELEAIILRCLAKDPQDRFETPQRLFESLANLGDLVHTPVTEQYAPDRYPVSTLTRIEAASSDPNLESLDETPVSLPASSSGSTVSWRRFLVVPGPIHAPSPRPWSTLIATIIVVVGVGSFVLFGGRLSSAWFSDDHATAGGSVAGAKQEGQPTGSAATESIQKVADPAPVVIKSKQLTAALADPERLVVQPGTPLRNVSDALEAAQNGQVIEVASNDMFRGEVRLPAKSLTLVANPEFHPTFLNTLRINGGGSIRIEGFHFEPYLANKPAIEVERMPERLEIAGCTFRGSDGVLITLPSTGAQSGQRTHILLERSFAAGNIVFGLAGVPPDLRLINCCMVADQAVFDWQLAPSDLSAPATSDVAFRNNTLVGRSMFHVRLDDQRRPITHLPRTSIRMDDNIFVFPQRYPCTFFRWEAWQRPDIVTECFVWSGANNAFSGLGTWSMATTMVLSDPAATPQVAFETPEEWQNRWATHVANNFKVPPEFRAGQPKKTKEILPSDFDLTEQSKQRELGSDKRPLGADIRSIPTPPNVQ